MVDSRVMMPSEEASRLVREPLSELMELSIEAFVPWRRQPSAQSFAGPAQLSLRRHLQPRAALLVR